MRLTISCLALLLFVGTASAEPASSECPATREIFERIKTGMFISMVENIFGCKGVLYQESEVMDQKFATYYWNGMEDGTLILITTSNRQVISKAQKGI